MDSNEVPEAKHQETKVKVKKLINKLKNYDFNTSSKQVQKEYEDYKKLALLQKVHLDKKFALAIQQCNEDKEFEIRNLNKRLLQLQIELQSNNKLKTLESKL